jgi:acyl dehydratase
MYILSHSLLPFFLPSFQLLFNFIFQVDQVLFKKPVDIGDLVRLKSRVVFTSDDPLMSVVHVEVTCQVVRPER